MTLPLSPADGNEWRVSAGEEPLSLGGADCDLVVDPDSQGAHGVIAWSDGVAFVQPVEGEGAQRLTCNGLPVAASRWLDEGDILSLGTSWRVEVRVGQGEITLLRSRGAPPEVPLRSTSKPQPAEDRVHWESGEAERLLWLRPAPFTPTVLVPKGRRFKMASRGALGSRLGWGLLALSILAGALFLWSLQPVELEILPQADAVALSGPWPQLQVGERYWLRPGHYQVTASKMGFRSLEESFELLDSGPGRFAFELTPLAGLLEVTVRPAVKATLSISGEVIGVLPLDPIELPPGDYAVQASADGYLPGSAVATVGLAGSLSQVTLELLPNSAEVTFSSAPVGATVRVDGRAVGTTPLAATLEAGTRRVEWILAGYRPQSRSLQVVAAQPIELPTARLVEADGNLIVSSEPSGASVTVLGEFRGLTPLDLDLAPGSDYDISVTKAGYQARAEKVVVRAGASETLNVVLVAITGEVTVAAEPAGAEVWIDGSPRGLANQTLALTAVEHQVEVRLSGFESYKSTVIPTPGAPQTLQVVLKSEQQRQAELTPDSVQTSAGQTLRLLAGGNFKLGAPRREPGRRANEAEREVEISKSFYLATREVTNREFRQFKAGHLSGQVKSVNLEVDHHPAVRVSWDDAAGYCNWLSDQEGLPRAYVMVEGRLTPASPPTKGYRLPTEAEWARAARFAEGRQGAKYSWGSSLPIPAGAGNFGDAAAQSALGASLPNYNDGFAGTSPVDHFPPNALGLKGLGDNASEWTQDRYAAYAGHGKLRDPQGPKEGDTYVIRGASWMDTVTTELRFSFRDDGREGRPDVGFRIARSAQ